MEQAYIGLVMILPLLLPKLESLKIAVVNLTCNLPICIISVPIYARNEIRYCSAATVNHFVFPFFNLIVVLFLPIFLATVIGELTSGLWIVHLGFIPSTWFILGCYVLAGIWALYCVPEIPRPTNNDAAVRFFSLENVKCFFKLFRKRRDAGRMNLLLLMLCGGLVRLSTFGIVSVEVLYVLKSPLCWSPTLVGYFLAFEAFVHGVGSVMGIPLLGTCFKTLNVVRVGIVTVILSFIVLAFSDRTWMVFVCK